MVRITGGVFRGRRLAVPRGVRPTAEVARKAVFDILGDAIEGARVLDAAAGSGAYGLEALSRGAAHATFVESDRRVLKVLRENIEKLAEPLERVNAKARPDLLGRKEAGRVETATSSRAPRAPFSIEMTSVASFVGSHRLRKAAFDVIFHDPPYEAESESDLAGLLSLLSSSGALFHERGDDLRLAPTGREPDEIRRYGTTRFLIFRGGGSLRA